MSVITELFENDDMGYKISKENAEKIIEKITKYLEIDVKKIEDKEQKKFINANYERLVKAARLGRLEVDTAGGLKITQHLKDKTDVIVFRAPGAKAKRAMAGYEISDFYGRIYALMGACCDVGEAGIDKLDIVDLSVVEVLGAIFLSA